MAQNSLLVPTPALHIMSGVCLNVKYRSVPGVSVPSGRAVGMPWFIQSENDE